MKKNLLKSLVLSCVLVCAPVLAFAATYEIDPVHSSVTFKVGHLVGKVTGTFDEFSGTIDFEEERMTTAQINATVKVASVNTRNEKRDAHLKTPDFFDVEQFPDATLVSKYINVEAGQIHADLTLHGVTKEVILDFVYNGSAPDQGGKIHIGGTATTKFDRRDFGMEYDPTGAGVGHQVELELQIEAVEKK